MGKILTGSTNCDIFNEIFAQNGNMIDCVVSIPNRKNSLASCVKYFDSVGNSSSETSAICFGIKNVLFNEELSGKKTREIALKLAKAIDKNSVEEVKLLKAEYGATKEFAVAKEFLNSKCKQIWDVFENKNIKIELPQAAMKALGITNKPDLEFLLADSLKFYEKDNGSTTVDIISSILCNKNLNYTFEDIYAFLKIYYTKNRCKYNLKTVSYLVYKLDYSKSKLSCLGIGDEIIKQVLKKMPVKDRLNYCVKNSFINKYIKCKT